MSSSVAAGEKLAATPAGWECSCGTAQPKHPGAATPVRTLVALREPWCPFCGQKYRPEFELR
jgi:hypothetical protein